METGGKDRAHNSTERAIEQPDAPAFNEVISEYIDAQRTETLTAPDETGEEAIEQVGERTEHEMIAHNIDRLESHFGDQIFLYKSHKGTITAIVNLCPPIKDLLSYEEGFDDIVSMVETYKVTEEAEETSEDDSSEEEAHIAAEAAAKEAADAAAREKAEKATAEKAAAEKEKTDAKEVQESKVATLADKETAPVPQTAQESGPGNNSSLDKTEAPEPPVKESVLERALEVERTEAENETPAPLTQPEEATSANSEVVDAPKTPEAIEGAAVGEQLPDEEDEGVANHKSLAVQPAASIEVEPASSEETTDLIEQADELLEAPDTNEDAPEVALYTNHIEGEDEEDTEQPLAPEERPIALFESPLLEEWRQLGEQHAPVEVALATIVDQLEALRHTDEDEVEGKEGEQPEHALFTAPEIIYFTKRVEKAKKAIEKLQTATTKEECHEHVQEVVTELTRLLTLLGYENPHDIIQEFLKQYPLQSLHDLLEYLETSLRHSIERQQLRKQQVSHPKNTSMLAHVAMRIMQVLAPKYETA